MIKKNQNNKKGEILLPKATFFLMANISMLIVILVFSLPGLEPGLLTPQLLSSLSSNQLSYPTPQGNFCTKEIY